MDSFKERERGFENQFAHDEELRFKEFARRNKLVGLWAAGLLGKTDGEAQAYAMDCVHADFEEAGHEEVFRKLSADLAGKADETTIRSKMHELLVTAKTQLMEE